MRPRKVLRIVENGKVLARKRTARDYVGAICADHVTKVFRGHVEGESRRTVVTWVKKRVSEKSHRVEKRIARITKKGALQRCRFIKAS